MATLVVVTNIPTPYRHHLFEALGHELRKRGHQLHVLYCASIEPNRSWIAPVGGAAHTGTLLRGRTVTVQGAYVHINEPLGKKLSKIDPTWVIAGGSWFAPASLNALAWCRMHGIPIFCWYEGHTQAVMHPFGPVSRVRRSVLGLFDGFVVPNGRSCSYIREQTTSAAYCMRLPNVVDEVYWQGHGLSRPMARASLGLPERRTALIVAALEPRKRVLEMVQSFLAISALDAGEVQLVVVGDGDLRFSLLEVLLGKGDRVIYLGSLPPETLRTVYAASDLFILGSRYDPNPLSMIEAAFAGCAVAATRSVGNSLELISEDSGLLLDDDDPTQFSQQVQSLFGEFARMDNKILRERGAESQEFARVGFVTSDVVAAFVDALLGFDYFKLKTYGEAQ